MTGVFARSFGYHGGGAKIILACTRLEKVSVTPSKCPQMTGLSVPRTATRFAPEIRQNDKMSVTARSFRNLLQGERVHRCVTSFGKSLWHQSRSHKESSKARLLIKIYATHLFMPTELHSGHGGPSMEFVCTFHSVSCFQFGSFKNNDLKSGIYLRYHQSSVRIKDRSCMSRSIKG